MNGEIKVTHGEVGIAQCQITSQGIAPGFNLGQELGINFGSAALSLSRYCKFIKGAFEDGILRKNGGNLTPPRRIFIVGKVKDTAYAWFVVGFGGNPAVVNGKFFKVGQDGERKLGTPGIAPKLIGRTDIVFDTDSRFFRFKEKFPCPTDAKAIVGGLGRAADLDRIFMDDVLVSLGIARFIGHVPSKCLEEGIDELASKLGLIIGRTTVGFDILLEPIDQLDDGLRGLSHS
ncbi:MAG TPA: hypothetical protein VGB26_03735 [Nitrospiria bacterium]